MSYDRYYLKEVETDKQDQQVMSCCWTVTPVAALSHQYLWGVWQTEDFVPSTYSSCIPDLVSHFHPIINLENLSIILTAPDIT